MLRFLSQDRVPQRAVEQVTAAPMPAPLIEQLVDVPMMVFRDSVLQCTRNQVFDVLFSFNSLMFSEPVSFRR